jgi:hypothetical protein
MGNHRLSINRTSKRGKEKSPSDTFNAKKRWTTIYWRVNKFLKKSHVVTRLAKERVSFLKINDISFFETPVISGVHWLSDMIGNTDQNNQV